MWLQGVCRDWDSRRAGEDDVGRQQQEFQDPVVQALNHLFVSLLVQVPKSHVRLITWQWSTALRGIVFSRRESFHLSQNQDLRLKLCLWSGEGAESIAGFPSEVFLGGVCMCVTC